MRYLKHLIYVIPIAIALFAKGIGILDSPAQAKENTKKISENKESIKDNSNEDKNYTDVNEEYKRQHMEQHGLLIKILEAQSK